MKDSDGKWTWISLAIIGSVMFLSLAIVECFSDSMNYYEKEAYSEYLESCEKMGVTPVPWENRK